MNLITRGTPEAAWSPWRESRPELSIADWRSMVVVAPHLDDEVLGVGGLIALARAQDLPVTVIAVTDGPAAEARVAECERAAYELAIEPPVRLGLEEGHVADAETILSDELALRLSELGGDGAWCATTWRRDGHPDHEAVGRATAAACVDTATQLLEFPVSMWHWATPQHPMLSDARAHTVTLPPAAVTAKMRALAQYHSQIRPMSDDPADEPILPPHVLNRFTSPTETFFL